jgi:N utilization substance protein B
MSQARRWARRFAVQAVYQWQMTAHDAETLEAQYRDADGIGKADFDYFQVIVQGVINNVTELDVKIAAHADRGVEAIDPVERAVLRISAFELMKRTDIPYRVVINEGIDLAKRYGAEQGHRYVNGLLDKLAKDLREPEVRAHAGSR